MPRRKTIAPTTAAVLPGPIAESIPTQPATDMTATEEPSLPAREPPAEAEHAELSRSYGPNPQAMRSDVAAGVRLQEDRRFRQMQVQFAQKPSDAVRQIVSDAGFRWQPHEQCWWKAIDREHNWKTRADAERLYEQVGMLTI